MMSSMMKNRVKFLDLSLIKMQNDTECFIPSKALKMQLHVLSTSTELMQRAMISCSNVLSDSVIDLIDKFNAFYITFLIENYYSATFKHFIKKYNIYDRK